MNFYILRHGIAQEMGMPGVDKDSERELVPEGRQKLRKIAAAMNALDLTFDVILTSPYVRAEQTAMTIAEVLKMKAKLELTDDLSPSGSMRDLIASINGRKPAPADVLLVGHEPYLSELISLLVSGGTDAISVVLKKGGFCRLSVETLKYGRCASLDWLLTPKQLGLMKAKD
jgi:phosphohistidine phosphatase